MGPPKSIFLIGREFIMIELIVSIEYAYTFEKFGLGWDILDGIYQGNGNGHLFKGF